MSTVLTEMATKHAWTLPLDKLAFKSLFQGATIAVDPTNQRSYLFQMQAREVGPKDVEDIYFSRYELTSTGLVYVDTMVGKKFGHVQTLHVRISAAGNPWIWVGLERYDKTGKSLGTDAHRVRYREGSFSVGDSDVDRIFTGSGSVGIISSPEWKVWLRRPSSVNETYQLFDEKTLIDWTSSKTRPKPIKSITMKRGSTTYQSSCATENEVLRVNGATENSSTLTSSLLPDISYDFTDAAPPGLKVTSEEPEAVFVYKGKAYVGKRFNSVERRVVAFFQIG